MLLPLLGCCALLGRPARPGRIAEPGCSFRCTARRREGALHRWLTTRGDGSNDELEAKLFLTPAEALTSSPALRRGASTLLHVIRGEDGRKRFARLVDKAIAQFEASKEDFDALLRAGEPWGAEGPSQSEAREALQGVLRLLDIGSELEQEVEVTSRSGFAFEGVMSGERVKFDLERREARSRWGNYSPFAVVSGPPALLGKRVVEVDSKNVSDSPAYDPLSGVAVGDTLYLAEPDRAAVLNLLEYDHLPEMSVWIAPLLEWMVKVEDGEADNLVAAVDGQAVGLEDLYFEKEMLDAVQFCLLTEKMETEKSRVEARMRRLAVLPASRELRKLIAEDPDLKELSDALRPRRQALYGAARGASLRSRPPNENENRVEIFNVDDMRAQGALAVFVLIVVLAVGASVAKLGDSSSVPGAQSSLPLYGLQTETAPRTVPLVYGTPLMPSQ